MAEIWKPQPIEVYKQWYDAIEQEASDRLTDWESRFVSDIGNRLAYGNLPTQNQAEKLEQIYVKYTS